MGKDLKTYTEANRHAWNQAALIHQKHRGERLEAEFSGKGHTCLDAVLTAKMLEIGVADKNIAHLCCNNGIELLSLMNLGAAGGVGFDISDVAITEAQRLASVSESRAEFVRTDVFEIPESFDGRFDIVLFTIGALCWLPDLNAIFAKAKRLLRENGHLVIYDLHPFTLMLAVEGEDAFKHPKQLEYSYFATEPFINQKGIDYVGHTTYESSTSYDFPHRFDEVLNTLCEIGFILRSFKEYPHDISNLFGHLEGEGKVPLCYLLHAKKGA